MTETPRQKAERLSEEYGYAYAASIEALDATRAVGTASKEAGFYGDAFDRGRARYAREHPKPKKGGRT